MAREDRLEGLLYRALFKLEHESDEAFEIEQELGVPRYSARRCRGLSLSEAQQHFGDLWNAAIAEGWRQHEQG